MSQQCIFDMVIGDPTRAMFQRPDSLECQTHHCRIIAANGMCLFAYLEDMQERLARLETKL